MSSHLLYIWLFEVSGGFAVHIYSLKSLAIKLKFHKRSLWNVVADQFQYSLMAAECSSSKENFSIVQFVWMFLCICSGCLHDVKANTLLWLTEVRIRRCATRLKLLNVASYIDGLDTRNALVRFCETCFCNNFNCYNSEIHKN